MKKAEVDSLVLDRVERSAFAIVFSEQESGKKFDWNAMKFQEE